MAKKKKTDENPDMIVRTIDSFMPDIVKKALLVSIGGAALTEEAIRKILGDLKVSKEIVSAIILQSNKVKDEIVRIISKELRSIITKANIDQEIRKLMQDVKINIQMEIDFKSKKTGESLLSIQPEVKRKPAKKKK